MGIFYQVPAIGGGNSYALEPFGMEELAVPSMRYQQVYTASAFAGLPPQGGVITEIVFAADPVFSDWWSTTLPAVEVQMSVTQRGPDSLSPVFAENIGASSVTVYQRGLLQLSGIPGTPITRIVFQTPYLYRPADGNLLLDIRNYQQALSPIPPNQIAGPIDAENMFGDSVSRMFAYDVNAPSGTADSLGLVTNFRITPIPEPSTMALLFLAIGMVTAWSWRKQTNTRNR